MNFEWDADKNAATRLVRGFDFFFAARIFDDPLRIQRRDDRRDYGEERWQTIGAIDGRVYLVVSTPRAGRTRINSARRAHDHEEETYRARAAGG